MKLQAIRTSSMSAILTLFVASSLPSWASDAPLMKDGPVMTAKEAKTLVTTATTKKDHKKLAQYFSQRAGHFEAEAKEPGAGITIKPAKLTMNYGDYFNKHIPEAYQRLLQDVIQGDQSLFLRSDEVEESWRWADSLLAAMQQVPMQTYAKDSWGPATADALFGECEGRWAKG